MEPSKKHLRHCLLFLFNQEKSVDDAQQILIDTYGDSAPSKSTCVYWFERFENGEFDVTDRERDGAPTKFENEELQALYIDERPYACFECPKRYRMSSHLAAHMKTHTGERNYECTLCLKAFMDGRSLKVHQRVHTGERPHVCTVCGKTFAFSGALSNHKKLHTRKSLLSKNAKQKDPQQQNDEVKS